MGEYFGFDRLTERFLRIEMLLKRRQVARLKAHGPFANPMRGQGRVLSILKMQPTISQKQLSYLLDMRQQSLSELLSKLEKSGFIDRAPSEDDRRAAIITLTEKGRAAADGPENPADEGVGLFDALTEDERAQLAPLLDKVIAALEAEVGEPDFRPPFGHGFGSCGFGPGPFGHDGPHKGLRHLEEGCEAHGELHRRRGECCEGHGEFRHHGEGCEVHGAFRHHGGCDGRGVSHRRHRGEGSDVRHGCGGRHGRPDDRAED